jgi:hypothetical protein
MKRLLIFILLFIVAATMVAAQNKTLAFNQVLLIGSTPQTVPAGTVWKVEGVAGSRVTQYMVANQSNPNYNPGDNLILINSVPVCVIQAVGTGAGTGTGSGTYYGGFSYAASPTSFPLWLPEGTTLAASTNVTYISVIEFNVITP